MFLIKFMILCNIGYTTPSCLLF